MNSLKNECSLYDCKELKELIIENPDLPLLIFVDEEAYSGEWSYEAIPNNCSYSIKELTLCKDMWMDKDDYEDELIKGYEYLDEYKNLTDKEFFDMIKSKLEETEFIKAICLYVG